MKKITTLAEDMVKRAKQAKAQVETVYQFLMKEAN